MRLMLPALIAEIGLLSFNSRHRLDETDDRSPWKEVAIKSTNMQRHPVMTHRVSCYLVPAAGTLIALLQQTAQASSNATTNGPS